jgi:GTP-binding protein Era
MITKNIMVTITGRPNVGKSTLANTLTGEKIAIVTNKPQTTRNRIFAIVNREDTQFVFIDTPGFHKARTKLGDYMVKIVNDSVTDVDAIALVVEPVPTVGTQESILIEKIKQSKIPSVLAINKIDTVKKEELLAVIAAYSQVHEFNSIVPISARTGENVDLLLDELGKFAQEGPQLFPDDMITDQPEKQIMAEIVREKLLMCLDREIPHGTAVVVTKFSEREDTEIIDVDVTIYCEKSSHKGMIIGKNGAMLKKIGSLAREDMEKFMGAKVFLQTWVKVKENWRDRDSLLKNFGYSED